MRSFPARGLVAALLIAPSALIVSTPVAALAESSRPGDAAPAETASQPSRPAQPSAAALAFAEELAGPHLSGMLARIAAGTQVMRALGELDGPAVATVLTAQIDAAVRRHRDDWARELAVAWSPLLSDAEMRSLAAEGQDSPHADSYSANRDAAAARMAELSQGLFQSILGEVVARTVRQLAPDEPAK